MLFTSHCLWKLYSKKYLIAYLLRIQLNIIVIVLFSRKRILRSPKDIRILNASVIFGIILRVTRKENNMIVINSITYKLGLFAWLYLITVSKSFILENYLRRQTHPYSKWWHYESNVATSIITYLIGKYNRSRKFLNQSY